MLIDVFSKRAAKVPGVHPSNMTTWSGGTTATTSGEDITERTSLQVSAVWACVVVLAENISSLPWMLYDQTPEGKLRVRDKKLARVLHDSANPEHTSYTFRHAMMVNALLWGNAFAEIVRDQAGEVSALNPIRAERVQIERVGGKLRYRISSMSAKDQFLFPEEMFHLPGLSFDGLYGTSTVAALREVIGLARALEQNASAHFGNSSRPSAILKFPEALKPESVKRLRESWERIHQGSRRSGKTAIIEEGGELQKFSETNEESQHIESRQFQVVEICRIFRVPPHMVADLQRATFSNIEQQFLEFVTQSLRPWLVKWEQESNRKLLTLPSERTMYTEMKVEALLRGDMKTRSEVYASGRSWGYLSANDVRDLENMNRIENGDIYLQPSNMIEAGTQPIQGTNTFRSIMDAMVDQSVFSRDLPDLRQPAGNHPGRFDRSLEKRSLEARVEIQARFRALLEAQVGVIVTKESKALLGAVKKYLRGGDREEFKKWAIEFFGESHIDYSRSQVAGVMAAYVALIMAEGAAEVGGDLEQSRVDEVAEEFSGSWSRQHVAIGLNQVDAAIRTALDDELLAEQLTIQAQDWQDKRAAKVARGSVAALGSIAVIAAYADGGVSRLVWRNVGENCPLCEAMDGRTVEISQPFLRPGDTVDGDEETEDLRVQQVMKHPPLHGGCNCVVTPG